MDVTAIVVARAGSVRLPGKALLPFADTTIIGHKVQQLKACKHVARVIVGSDSRAILAEGKRYGAIPLNRDVEFCDEASRTANDMIADVVGRVTGETILWAHPTNPLVKPETYNTAIEAYFNRDPARDSLVSVFPMRRHAWWHGLPLNHRPWLKPHKTGNELDPVCFQDGAIFIQSRLQMQANRNFFGTSPMLFAMDPVESTDIDTEADYVIARALWELMNK